MFATFLAKTVQHASIKVYLSGVRALHIDQGFSHPLAGCLRLRRVLRGMKRCQGSPVASRLPITDDLMLVIWNSLDLSLPDHSMFWAASCLGYFGLLRASEFTVPNLTSFSPSLHLSVQDISVDSMVSPSCMRVNMKGSKTDPFRQGCYVHIGAGHLPLCALSALMTYLSLCGAILQALYSCLKTVDLCPGLPSLNGFDKLWPQPGFLAIFPATVFALGRPQ